MRAAESVEPAGGPTSDELAELPDGAVGDELAPETVEAEADEPTPPHARRRARADVDDPAADGGGAQPRGARSGRGASGRRRSDSTSEDSERAAAGARTNGAGARAPVEHYDDLEPDEIIGLVDSLEPPDLQALLDYERAQLARPRVISAIEGVLTRHRTSQRG
jgi:hypothetical protein